MTVAAAMMTHRYVGRLRPDWHGRDCRVTVGLKGRRRGTVRNVEVEFFDRTRTACPFRCLRKLKA